MAMGRGRAAIRSRLRRAGAAGILAWALCALACASTVAWDGGRYRHARLGYSMGAPGEGWGPIALEGADLAFRGPLGARMMLASRCGTPLAAPRTLARHLLIGTSRRSLLEEGEVGVSGRSAWKQAYETSEGGRSRVLESVTLVARGCVFDWVLTAAPGDEHADRAFDAWWGTFELPEPQAGAAHGE